MAKFYFTYGTSGQPYFGGWTEVVAPNRNLNSFVMNKRNISYMVSFKFIIFQNLLFFNKKDGGFMLAYKN